MDCIFEISQSSICSAFIIKHLDIWASFPFFVSLLPYVPFTPEIFTASSFLFVVALFSPRCHFLNAYPYFSDNDWILRRWGMCFQQELFALHSRCQHANLVDILHNSPLVVPIMLQNPPKNKNIWLKPSQPTETEPKWTEIKFFGVGRAGFCWDGEVGVIREKENHYVRFKIESKSLRLWLPFSFPSTERREDIFWPVFTPFFCPLFTLCWSPLFLPFSRHLLTFFSPQKMLFSVEQGAQHRAWKGQFLDWPLHRFREVCVKKGQALFCKKNMCFFCMKTHISLQFALGGGGQESWTAISLITHTPLIIEGAEFHHLD